VQKNALLLARQFQFRWPDKFILALSSSDYSKWVHSSQFCITWMGSTDVVNWAYRCARLGLLNEAEFKCLIQMGKTNS